MTLISRIVRPIPKYISSKKIMPLFILYEVKAISKVEMTANKI